MKRIVAMFLVLLAIGLVSFDNASAQTQDVEKKAIFGNSITWSAVRKANFTSSVIEMAVPGATANSLMRKLRKLPNDTVAMSVLLGTNEFWENDDTPEVAADSIFQFLDAAMAQAPDADVYLISTLPTKAGDSLNAKINILNERMALMVDAANKELETEGLQARIFYVDFHSLFVEADGLTGKVEYVRDHNIHLTKDGQTYLLQLLEELLDVNTIN